MKRCIYIFIVFAALGGLASAEDAKGDTKGKVCHKEQQCNWENFKKICTWVTVCR
jgi:hypothetical protein